LLPVDDDDVTEEGGRALSVDENADAAERRSPRNEYGVPTTLNDDDDLVVLDFEEF
jgi:hypothetical protein